MLHGGHIQSKFRSTYAEITLFAANDTQKSAKAPLSRGMPGETDSAQHTYNTTVAVALPSKADCMHVDS